MSYEDYARKIAEKAEEAKHIERLVKKQAERRRDDTIAAMRPLYDTARAHIMTDLKAHGLVEAIRRHEIRRSAIDRALNDTL